MEICKYQVLHNEHDYSKESEWNIIFELFAKKVFGSEYIKWHSNVPWIDPSNNENDIYCYIIGSSWDFHVFDKHLKSCGVPTKHETICWGIEEL